MPIDWPSSTGNGVAPKSSTMWRDVAIRCMLRGDAEIAGHRGDRRLRAGVYRFTYGCDADHGGDAGRPGRAVAMLAWPLAAGIAARRRRLLLATGSRLDGRLAGSSSQANWSSRLYGAARGTCASCRSRRSGTAGCRRCTLHFAGVDDVVAGVVRDRADRAGLLAGVAADADLGVDQVLAVHRRRWGRQRSFAVCCSCARFS